MFLYRCGSMPTVKDIRNSNALMFDQLSRGHVERQPILTGARSPSIEVKNARAKSVFMTFNIESAEQWKPFREFKCIDLSIWKINVPDYETIFAHETSFYNEAMYLLSANETRLAKTYINNYWTSGVRTDDFTDFYNEKSYEVLVPYDVALNATWELVS